jgi:biopolymer transport protein ExbD
MSHRADAGKAEPNLTPLLDVVLQLLMFFIMVTRFVSSSHADETKEDRLAMVLPVAQSALPLDKVSKDILYVDMDQDSNLVVTAFYRTEKLPLNRAERWLKDQYEFAQKVAKGGPVETVIILRANAKVDWGRVSQLMDYCEQAGYKEIRVRAEAKVGA